MVETHPLPVREGPDQPPAPDQSEFVEEGGRGRRPTLPIEKPGLAVPDHPPAQAKLLGARVGRHRRLRRIPQLVNVADDLLGRGGERLLDVPEQVGVGGLLQADEVGHGGLAGGADEPAHGGRTHGGIGGVELLAEKSENPLFLLASGDIAQDLHAPHAHAAPRPRMKDRRHELGDGIPAGQSQIHDRPADLRGGAVEPADRVAHRVAPAAAPQERRLQEQEDPGDERLTRAAPHSITSRVTKLT